MLSGIRASPMVMPFSVHHLSPSDYKMDGYNDTEPWAYTSQSSTNSTHQFSQVFEPMYNFSPQGLQSVHPRHHSIATSHVVNQIPAPHVQTATPPPTRQQVAGGSVKAQPAFKRTWHGFLDTTKDAMTIVEATLQGRLSHISRRPHDKERAEMLTSGTVLVYEENASGIKRWTDAVHWSPSRVMNNCLIYRQLVRALKPEEKKSALNPSCGNKRKRKESAGPAITNSGDNVTLAEDEYEHSVFETLPGDATPTESFGKAYANFAQSLTPDQQRRFCGSLIDSYEFKEGGLMKKTISVKYNGAQHHVISYYSLEDVVAGKLKRPSEDPELTGVHPRNELLSGWKVGLDDEETRDISLTAGYSQHIQPSQFHHPAIGAVTHGLPVQAVVQAQGPLPVPVSSEYWHGGHVQHYAPYAQQTTSSPYTQQATQQYPSQSPAHRYPPQQSSGQPFPQQSSASQYQSQQAPNQQYSQASANQQYAAQPQATQHYPSTQHVPQPRQYSDSQPTLQYAEPQHASMAHQSSYSIPHSQVYDAPVPVAQSVTPVPPSTPSQLQQHDPQRRASAPVPMQSYGHQPSHTPYQPGMQPNAYYY
ncbi:hypothetical protein K491DRAFT_459475 [Lophiostoma macrostomum CBS 122681]|uniref:Camp independent regulatory protein n=1 Tax=Lophiostoma macrostomum CBS 122681 TaxID=1314788 RepID=A0A6A6T4X8_9PLEO|nr:hypothetical protein K491DRAFT_459475 [Lophiostoma macrostomum CBS 122681]